MPQFFPSIQELFQPSRHTPAKSFMGRGTMRRALTSLFVALRLPALLTRTTKFRGLWRWPLRAVLSIIDDAPIWAKASAASAVLLLCLIGLGTKAYLALDQSSTSLLRHAVVELPKQRAVSGLTGDIIATHLKIFRLVTWTQMGVGADSEEVLAELKALGTRLRLLGDRRNLSPVEIEHVAVLSAQWNRYTREMTDVLAATTTDSLMASMLLTATDDEFRNIAAELQNLSDLVTSETTTRTQQIATDAQRNRNILALGGSFGVLISLLVTVFVGRSVVAPIRAVTQAMQGVSSGHGRLDIGYRNRKDEIGQMVEAIVIFQEDMERQKKLLADRQHELCAQNARFDTALDHMSQGLAMFDAEQRLVVCNRRYAELYGLARDQVTPGTTIRRLLEYRHAKGVFGDVDFETFARDWLIEFRKASSRTQELADGRIVSVVRRPMTDGGLVSTTEDVTERHKLHALLARQNEQLDAALNNMVQGLAMFDAQHRVVIANERYASMYGLTVDQVEPGTTLRQILQYRIDNGHYASKSVDQVLGEVLARMAEKDSSNHLSELKDGRTIAVSVQRMASGGTVTTHQDITERRRSEARITHMALHDGLTGLANRVLLNERLELALARVKRGEMVATHVLDLDHFKIVNDALGHSAGDKLLRMVTDRLGSLVRETDTIARMGGDEFAILQVAISQPADATSLALRIIEMVSKPYDIEGNVVTIGTSIGIAVGPSDGVSPDQLIRNADLALYRAKGDGRGTFRFFEPEMDAQMQARRTLECDMRNALTAGEFELYYQPIVDLSNDEISGFEALIRWHHPTKGMVPPDKFIPLAEEIGLIIPIGEWAIREACATAAKWPSDLRIAVNLSPVQFRSPGLLHAIVGALATSGLAPWRLELEITETVLLQNSEATLAMLYQMREIGVRVAMDDFGTGYSSLSYLQSFPFDKIKIDRSFVRDIVESSGSLNIVRAVAALAKGLGMSATAEGVETLQQLDAVRSEGCTEMQGFFFSQPVPAHEIEKLFLATRNGSKLEPGPAAA